VDIKIVKVGYLEANCYVLTKDNQTIIIDPGDDFLKIKEVISNEVIGILCTHSHFDHIGALGSVKEYYQAPVYSFENINSNKLEIGSFKFEVIKTPGHSYDSVSYLIDDKLFCGDFIFASSIGRTDLPTGSMKEMQESINKILKYPDYLIVYPGHGNITTLGKEKDSLNFFFT